ncbi:MAG TPA: M23 family metallopeptidase [Xanthobacteraceae bacterium]|jgi:murein DD-endopeptidase MepM/ murein hydrolase activator NlpD|nr:M23 family metallopeptidase [Xanthobacteraceae bacterium]
MSGLERGKRHAALRSNFEAEHIDLGSEAPLSVDGEGSGLVDRRRVSVQWLSGVILTGLCGAALMSGAVFAALDGETNFATVPERVEGALRGAVGAIAERVANATRKADRLPPPGEANAARQVIRVSTTTRGNGNREIVRVRPFIRVAGNLSLSVSELSANIPRFNAQKMAAQSEGIPVSAQDAADAQPDAEVSFVTRDLNTVLPRAKIAAVASVDEVLARVREAANWDGKLGQKLPLLASAVPPTLTAYAPERQADPYAGFEPRIVPENVSLLPKTTAQVTGGNAWNERSIVLKKGDSVSAFLREMGATADEIKAITAAFGGRGKDSSPRDGYKLRVLLAPASDGIRLRPVRVVIATDTAVEAMVAWSELGKYVAVDVRHANSVASSSSDEDDDGNGVRLYQSIYETGLRNHIPRPVIDDFVRIYSYDIDFQRKVQPGDSFEVLFAGEDENPNENSKAEVLFASLTTSGETRKFFRYQTGDDNLVDYYDESGKSAKKFLVRKPVADGNVTSGFGGRNHPLLGYDKMHTGVDWASSTGTPVFAAGNGVIDKIGWEGGYGKYIRIRHANGYETAYGHMSAFARNMEAGKKVRQGQVIGYVGSTGLSTGAHLHYEILINGRFVDPMRIKLPRGRVLEGPLLAGFDQERARLDAMMTRATPSRYAQTR